jgi:translation elongation factor P/translation initiation factor 5A
MLKIGQKIWLNNEPMIVKKVEFYKPGKGKPVTRCTLKNILTDKVIEKS